jgi:hypothetical protein
MHPNVAHAKLLELSNQLTEANTRFDDRLDRLEAKIDRILRAAGLVVEIPTPDPTIGEDAELIGEPTPDPTIGQDGELRGEVV